MNATHIVDIFLVDIVAFIGLGMLIGYADKYKNDGIMDNKYYQDPSTKTGLKNGSESISKLLYDSNPKDSTTSMHIKTVMKDYAKSRNISISYTSRWTPFFTVTTISDALKNDTPVELFGTFKYEINDTTKSTGNHAIVAYEMGYVQVWGLPLMAINAILVGVIMVKLL